MDVLTEVVEAPRIGHDVLASARVEWFKVLAWRFGITVVGLAWLNWNLSRSVGRVTACCHGTSNCIVSGG